MLHAGGVIAYPTEAVYGLGCDPQNRAAIQRLLQLKNRNPALGLILIADKLERLIPYINVSSPRLLDKICAEQETATTWVVPAAQIDPLITGGRDSVAVRIVRHRISRNLCQAFGAALISTSANRSGKKPAKTALAVRHQFDGALDVILHGPLGGETRPSRLIDARTDTILRS